MMNYSLLDRPEVLSVIFHPRPELGPAPVAGRRAGMDWPII